MCASEPSLEVIPINAEVGKHGLCLGVEAAKIDRLTAGGIPIHEPEPGHTVARNVAAGRLQFTTDVQQAVNHGTLQFIGVGTAPDEDGSADLQYVLAAARNIRGHTTPCRRWRASTCWRS